MSCATENSSEAHQAASHLYRIGLDEVAGVLRNGMTDWQNAGLALEKTGEWTVHELKRAFKEFGLPRAIRTDNGVPFGSASAFFGLSKLRGGCAWGYSSSASGRVIRSRMADTSACT